MTRAGASAGALLGLMLKIVEVTKAKGTEKAPALSRPRSLKRAGLRGSLATMGDPPPEIVPSMKLLIFRTGHGAGIV